MKIEGTHELNASRERVYAALTDPEVLCRCIRGCQSMEKTAEDTYATTIKAGVGAIKGTFKGSVHLEEMRPPEHYRIVVEAKGGVGFAKGTGDLNLTERDNVTLITYEGELQVGGVIAGVGQRMIQATAKMMASQFFSALENEVKSEPTNKDETEAQ